MQHYDDNDPGDETPDEMEGFADFIRHGFGADWESRLEAILDYFDRELDEAFLDQVWQVEGAVRFVTVIHEDGAVTEFDIGPDIDWDDAVDMAAEVMYTVDNINHPARSALV